MLQFNTTALFEGAERLKVMAKTSSAYRYLIPARAYERAEYYDLEQGPFQVYSSKSRSVDGNLYL